MVTDYQTPKEAKEILQKLHDSGYEAYIVGGCVRDVLRGEKPRDWDVTTNAKPEEIIALFPDSFYENKFLTVTVRTGSENPSLKEVEVTTYRAEGKYTDKRHPDEVRFAQTLEEDLSRRDFTINAIALEATDDKRPGSRIIDPYGGREDLKNKLIKSVGEPEKRLEEDALRMLRAVRFSAQLGFAIEEETKETIKKLSGNIDFIAKDRIRDELNKIFATSRAREAVEQMHELGLLGHIMPEVEEGIGVENRPKIFTVWEHNLRSLEYGSTHGFSPDVCLTALFHDVGKPRTKGPMKNNEWTFYGHDLVGSRMAIQILERLHYPRETIEKIAKLIRWHLFKYDPDEGITDSSIRRLIRNVGAGNMEDLVRVRICDRMGMGVPKAVPYRLRHFQFRVEKILREEEAPTPKMLKINGEDIMKILEIAPGPKVGKVIEVLLQEVMDDPSKNTKEFLEGRTAELGKLTDAELTKIAEEAENKTEMLEDQREAEIKAKYYVK